MFGDYKYYAFSWLFFHGFISKVSIWFRLGKRGIAFKRTPLPFSERNGFRKYLKLPFGWRVVYLTPPYLLHDEEI